MCARSLRNALTGVSRSAMSSRHNGTSTCSAPARALAPFRDTATSSAVGVTPCVASRPDMSLDVSLQLERKCAPAT